MRIPISVQQLGKTLQEAIRETFEFIHRSQNKCLLCEQRVFARRYSLNGLHARALIQLWTLSRGRAGSYHHHQDFCRFGTGADQKMFPIYSTLKAYSPLVVHGVQYGYVPSAHPDGLAFLVAANKRTTDENAAGLWALTPRGCSFVRGQLTVPRDVFVFNDMLHHMGGPEVTIADVLGKPFNYQRLQQGW